MEIAGYIAALLIGISLGMIGGGGSIITVPVLVYLFHIDAIVATTYSLFIVGFTSLTGGVRAYIKKHVDFKSVSEFGIPSIFSVFVTRHFILPAIPPVLFASGNLTVTKNAFLMILFAVLMIVVGFFMFKHGRDENGDVINSQQNKIVPLAILGLLTGFVTGLLGAGGGFLIIPALVFFIRLPMKTAVGTSLVIISINSLFGFLFTLKQFEYDWQLILLFTLIAMTGVLIGHRFADKISPNSLRKIFGGLVIVMAVYILIEELFLKTRTG
jgi:uncharacterized membrane protein YfcA